MSWLQVVRCDQVSPSNPAVHQTQVVLALLYNLCCLFLQLVQEFHVFHPCLVYLLAHRVLGFPVALVAQVLQASLVLQLGPVALDFLEGR